VLTAEMPNDGGAKKRRCRTTGDAKRRQERRCQTTGKSEFVVRASWPFRS
jgi:hypothetical protein